MIPTSLSLLDRLRDPADHEAWECLVRVYSPFLRNWLGRGKCPRSDTDDLLQEILIVLVRRLPEFERRRTGSFRSWLRVLAAAQVANYYRAKKRTHAVSIDPEQIISRFEDPSSDLSLEWNEQHDRHVIRELLEWIRPEFEVTTWMAFRLTAITERKGSDVASELGITDNAVYLAKKRVLRRLKEVGSAMFD